jgi:hypothetical protein
MPVFLVRIEGVDFAATLYDTDDLSTIRGASQAYFYMPQRIAELLRERTKWKVPDEFPRGASIGVFRVETPEATTERDVEAAIADAIAATASGQLLDELRRYLSFTWAAVPSTGDYGADVYRLEARCRTRQWQRLTVDIPPEPTALPCRIDRRRPGYENAARVADRYERASKSVAARHDYGRNQRHHFYSTVLAEYGGAYADPRFQVTQSLQDIVDARRVDDAISGIDPKERVPMAAALSSKLAVIYLDGNKFTAIRESTVFGPEVADKEHRHRDFDKLVRLDKRPVLLKAVIDRLRADGRNQIFRDGRWRLRFETLMWGGDESLFVMPGWAVMDVLPSLMEALEGWEWQGHKLSHAVGVVICNVKTPIAVARRLAEELAEVAKDKDIIGSDLKALRNAVSIQVFESVEPPREDLAQFRKELYGTEKPACFTQVGKAGVATFLGLIQEFQKQPGGLPRSQLYGVIARARAQHLLEAGKAEAGLRFLDDEKDGVAHAFGRAECTHLLPKLRSRELGYSGAAPLVPLLRLAELWDYVDPFGSTAPAGAAA